MPGYYNLKALIKAIRSCKTLADERSLIQKESAAIRTAFKEEDSFSRHNNIAKLLYIHMLGYPAHFGQIECLKLVASPRFSDKRLGYLGIMLLLDENQEVLTLVTNSLKNDMNHSNMYAVGLALCTFANISSEEMSRDLCNEIEKLLGSSNTYIRKKSALCALRVIRKVPELVDHFLDKAKGLLHDRNHGVLLAGVTLVTEMCRLDRSVCDAFRKTVSLLVKHLKALVTTGYSPEHDVNGITDPFLQVKILRLLRVLGSGNAEASEAMNDILAQVATNTDSSKNVGNAILYEAVLTILEIEADSGLRVMAINILGKFLGNRDNNIRYVALNTLNQVAVTENAVQRHRDVVLSCLADGDVSIRRRALELSYALINEQNVKALMRELLSFLEVADNEFKLGLTTQICLAAERYAPDKRWHIDTMLRVLQVAGNHVRDEVMSSFIRLVCHTVELQSYTVSRLFRALQADVSQESLTLVAVWILGEFGDSILQSSSNGIMTDNSEEISDVEVLDLLEMVIKSPYANSLIRQYTLTALSKFAIRLGEASSPNAANQVERIRDILSKYSESQDLELQQRSVEFEALFTKGDLVNGVLEHMPAPEIRATIMGTVSEKRNVGSTRTDTDSLVDLMGDDTQGPNTETTSSVNAHDLLADIFGGSSDPAPSAVSSKPANPVNDIMSLFGNSDSARSPGQGPGSAVANSADLPSGLLASGSAVPSGTSQQQAGKDASKEVPTQAKSTLQQYTAYEKNDLKITLTPKVNPSQPGMVQILVRFTATASVTLENVNFQAAVPKTQQLQMLAMSNGNVAPGTVESQQMRIIAPPGAQIRLRLRITFQHGSQSIQEQVDFSAFPANLTQGG